MPQCLLGGVASCCSPPPPGARHVRGVPLGPRQKCLGSLGAPPEKEGAARAGPPTKLPPSVQARLFPFETTACRRLQPQGRHPAGISLGAQLLQVPHAWRCRSSWKRMDGAAALPEPLVHGPRSWLRRAARFSQKREATARAYHARPSCLETGCTQRIVTQRIPYGNFDHRSKHLDVGSLTRGARSPRCRSFDQAVRMRHGSGHSMLFAVRAVLAFLRVSLLLTTQHSPVGDAHGWPVGP